MKKSLSLLVLLGISVAACLVAGAQQKKIYPDRWLYLNVNFNSNKGLEEASDLIHTAAQHGLNAVVLLVWAPSAWLLLSIWRALSN